ncbi:hypothetical protein Tco_0649125 [Tanacetum coccineum]
MFYIVSQNKGWISFSKRFDSFPVCYSKPLDSVKNWNDHFFWVDSAIFPLSVLLNKTKVIAKDPLPVLSQYDARAYDYLCSHTAPFRKFPEAFLFLVGISRYYPLDEDYMDLFSFIRHSDPMKVLVRERTVAEGEPKLLTMTEDRVVSLDPPTTATSGETVVQDALKITIVEDISDVVVEKGKKLKPKRKPFGNSKGSEHPPKRLRDDYHATGSSTGGKSLSAIRGLIPKDDSYHSPSRIETPSFCRSLVTNPPVVTIDITTNVDAGVSASGMTAKSVGSSKLFEVPTSLDSFFSVQDPDPSALSRIYIPKWKFNVGMARQTCLGAEVKMRAEHTLEQKSRLEEKCNEQAGLLSKRDSEIDELKALLSLKEAEATEAIRLRSQLSSAEAAGAAKERELCALKERNIALEKEKGELDVKIADLAASVKVREQEVADLDVVVASVESQKDMLVGQVHELEMSSACLNEKVTAYEGFVNQLEKFQDDRMKEVNDKFDKFDADVVEMVLHLEENFYPRFLTTIAGRRSIEKGIQDGLSAGITHGQEGNVLTDVAAFNPSTESDYVSALKGLHDVYFSLLAELKSNKDAMQPHVDQLMVPIHHSSDQTIVGATSLSFSLDVSHNRVRKIRDNIASEAEGTSGTAPSDTVGTTLSTVVVLTSSVPPITTDEGSVVGMVEFEKEELETTP